MLLTASPTRFVLRGRTACCLREKYGAKRGEETEEEVVGNNMVFRTICVCAMNLRKMCTSCCCWSLRACFGRISQMVFNTFINGAKLGIMWRVRWPPICSSL